MTMEHSTLCPNCRHIMVKLDGFDGTSSADAVSSDFGSGAGSSFQNFDWIGIVLFGAIGIVGTIFEETKIALKRRRAKRLRKAVLPDYPFSLVCPLCLEIVRRR